jgi:hypothetical protein
LAEKNSRTATNVEKEKMDASTQHECQTKTDGGTTCNCVETIEEAERTTNI